MRAPALTIARARKLRRELSLPELLLWDCLRRRGTDGLRFRRQHPIGRYILDFYCSSARLAIEVDGPYHDDLDQIHHDARRDEWLAGQGIRVMRIAATDILNDQAFEGILDMIAGIASGADIPDDFASPSKLRPPPPPSAVPLPRKRGRIRGGEAGAYLANEDGRDDASGSPPAKRGWGTAEGSGGGHLHHVEEEHEP
jgi:very-short-patch-repair endonuclease